MTCRLASQVKSILCIPLKLLDNGCAPFIMLTLILSLFIEEFSSYHGVGAMRANEDVKDT